MITKYKKQFLLVLTFLIIISCNDNVTKKNNEREADVLHGVIEFDETTTLELLNFNNTDVIIKVYETGESDDLIFFQIGGEYKGSFISFIITDYIKPGEGISLKKEYILGEEIDNRLPFQNQINLEHEGKGYYFINGKLEINFSNGITSGKFSTTNPITNIENTEDIILSGTFSTDVAKLRCFALEQPKNEDTEETSNDPPGEPNGELLQTYEVSSDHEFCMKYN